MLKHGYYSVHEAQRVKKNQDTLGDRGEVRTFGIFFFFLTLSVNFYCCEKTP